MAKRIEYHLEIYEPGSKRDALKVFQSDVPFPAFTAGDLLRILLDSSESAGSYLRVVQVEHMVWEVEDHNSHKLLVYTERISESEAFPDQT